MKAKTFKVKCKGFQLKYKVKELTKALGEANKKNAKA